MMVTAIAIECVTCYEIADGHSRGKWTRPPPGWFVLAHKGVDWYACSEACADGGDRKLRAHGNAGREKG